MFGIDLNPVSLITTAMFGPAGGLIAQLAQQVVSQFGQQLLGQIGQGMGLPQSAIDLAQSSYSAANGDMQGTASNLIKSDKPFAGKSSRSEGFKSSSDRYASSSKPSAKPAGKQDGWDAPKRSRRNSTGKPL